VIGAPHEGIVQNEALGKGIITLLKDLSRAGGELGANARTTVLANFDWPADMPKDRVYLQETV